MDNIKYNYLISTIVNHYNKINNESYPLTRESVDLFIIKSILEQDNIIELVNTLLTMELMQKYENGEIKNYKLFDIKKNIPNTKSTVYICNFDITQLEIECIVNAANSDGLGCFNPQHTCIDNIIHKKCGPALRKECGQILNGKKIKTGTGIITKSYNIPSNFIIHTVGPNITINSTNLPTHQNMIELANCYTNILELCKLNNISSVAIPNISTGLYGFDLKLASQIAFNTVINWIKKNPTYPIDIVFVCWTRENYELYIQQL